MLDVDLLRPLLRAAWGPDTCDPHDLANWGPENPARGQCGRTALVVQDLLGGELIVGQVHVDGVKIGCHWWNRLPDGTTVDLTAGQFYPGEMVTGGDAVTVRRMRPDGVAANTSCCGIGFSARWPTNTQSWPRRASHRWTPPTGPLPPCGSRWPQ